MQLTRIITSMTIAAISMTTIAAQQRRTQQPLLAGTSAIRGTVIDDATKAPIAACTVRVALPPGDRRNEVITAADGAYEFPGIAEGNYSMFVECPGYLWSCAPANSAAGPPCSNVMVFKDQKLSNVDFAVTPAATVRGRVVTSSGKPVKGASVRIGGPFLGNRLVRVQSATTKDDGSFEVGGLPGGSWAFEVDIPPAPGAYRSPMIYYPGVMKRDDAGVVDVPAGKVTSGVTITVPAILDRTLTVRVPPPDGTMTDVVVTVIRTVPLMTRRVELDSEGQSVLTGLIEGRYVVAATAVSVHERWADYQAFDFVADSAEVSLQLQPTGKIHGRIVTDRGGLPSLEGSSIGAAWVESDVTLNPVNLDAAPVAADGAFEIGGIFGRRLLQLVNFDPAWRITSVLQGRSDVTTTGIDVTPGSDSEVTVVVRPR